MDDQNNNQPPPPEEAKKLDDLLKETQSPLFVANSIFPFQLFPDSIVIETSKVSFVHKSLFFKEVVPILTENIINVLTTRNPFFAAIEIEYQAAEPTKDIIKHLKPADAARVKRLIVGIMYAKKMGVSFEGIPQKELIQKLEKIGEGSHELETLT